MNLVLASASPRRKQLLEQLGLSFEIFPSVVDETPDPSLEPADLARGLAEAKASQVARRLAGGPKDQALVIGADTIVIIDGEVLGKPADADDARRMISRLAGRTHRVITGVALCRPFTGETMVEHEETLVWIRPLEPHQIASYVATGEPMDKAGAYAIQGLGSALVYRIEGCYYNVVGLPVPRLVTMLQRFGIDVLSGSRSRPDGNPSFEERPGGGRE